MTALKILDHIIDETTAARAHYQIWWTFRNLALPEFYETMNDFKHVEFFHASNSGHYKLIYVALGKIYDSDTRSAGIAAFKSALRTEGRADVADKLQADLSPMKSHVQRILGIRNRTVLHNEHAIERSKVYEVHGIKPDEIWELIDATSEAINVAAEALRHPSRVPGSRSYEAATLAMLERLQRGGT